MSALTATIAAKFLGKVNDSCAGGNGSGSGGDVGGTEEPVEEGPKSEERLYP